MTEEQPAQGVHRVCRFNCRPLDNTLCLGAVSHTADFSGPRPSVFTLRLSGPRAPLFRGDWPRRVLQTPGFLDVLPPSRP